LSTIIKTPTEPDRESVAADARDELLRQAEAQGVKPFTSLQELAGDPAFTGDFDVEEFLRQVRDDRDRPSNGNPQ
jgi:hypothetical protein